jgi:hypothetical protein
MPFTIPSPMITLAEDAEPPWSEIPPPPMANPTNYIKAKLADRLSKMKTFCVTCQCPVADEVDDEVVFEDDIDPHSVVRCRDDRVGIKVKCEDGHASAKVLKAIVGQLG